MRKFLLILMLAGLAGRENVVTNVVTLHGGGHNAEGSIAALVPDLALSTGDRTGARNH